MSMMAAFFFEPFRGLKHALRQRGKHRRSARKARKHAAERCSVLEPLELRMLLSTVTWTGAAGDNL